MSTWVRPEAAKATPKAPPTVKDDFKLIYFWNLIFKFQGYFSELMQMKIWKYTSTWQ